MSDERILQTMRAAFWAEAKGKLSALLCTYWSRDENFEPMNKAVEDFFKLVEDNGWAE